MPTSQRKTRLNYEAKCALLKHYLKHDDWLSTDQFLKSSIISRSTIPAVRNLLRNVHVNRDVVNSNNYVLTLDNMIGPKVTLNMKLACALFQLVNPDKIRLELRNANNNSMSLAQQVKSYIHRFTAGRPEKTPEIQTKIPLRGISGLNIVGGDFESNIDVLKSCASSLRFLECPVEYLAPEHEIPKLELELLRLNECCKFSAIVKNVLQHKMKKLDLSNKLQDPILYNENIPKRPELIELYYDCDFGDLNALTESIQEFKQIAPNLRFIYTACNIIVNNPNLDELIFELYRRLNGFTVDCSQNVERLTLTCRCDAVQENGEYGTFEPWFNTFRKHEFFVDKDYSVEYQINDQLESGSMVYESKWSFKNSKSVVNIFLAYQVNIRY